MDFIIKIRWNCGTERYVTGYAGRDEVPWYSGKPAYRFSTYEEARGIMLGLNINHLIGLVIVYNITRITGICRRLHEEARGIMLGLNINHLIGLVIVYNITRITGICRRLHE